MALRLRVICFGDGLAPSFGFTSTLIAISVAYLVLSEAAEHIARWLWPIPFDPFKTKEYELRASCEIPRVLGFFLIAGPILPVLVPVLLFKIRKSWPRFVSGVCLVLLFLSPIPEKLAHLVFPADMLKVPSHCKTSSR